MEPAADVHLRDLRYFAAVVDASSFTRAAEALYVSQPALSKQVRALESRIGARLIDRGPDGLRLTPQGEALLPHARRLVEQWAEIRAEVRRAGAGDTLVVGLQTAVGRDLTRTLLAATRAQGRRMQVRLVSWADATSGLADGSVDVALLWRPLVSDQVEGRTLLTEPRWLAMPADHRLAGHAEIAWTDLVDEPFVALPLSAGPLRDFWLAADERTRPAVVGAEADTAEGAFEAVASGSGVVLLAEGNARLLQRPDVVCRPVRGLGPCELAVAWRRGDARDRVAEAATALSAAIPGSAGPG